MPHNKRSFLTLIDVAVSAGAAVIIFAAWAKLTHQSYADMMLTIGMWTETGIFLIYAIVEWVKPKHHEEDDEPGANQPRPKHCAARCKHPTAYLPRWSGQPLNDGRLVILGEQGIGDQIMFASCLPDVAQEGVSATLFCEERLVDLFARSFPSLEVRNLDTRERAAPVR